MNLETLRFKAVDSNEVFINNFEKIENNFL